MQILNVGGNHWINTFAIGCEVGSITIYDSLHLAHISIIITITIMVMGETTLYYMIHIIMYVHTCNGERKTRRKTERGRGKVTKGDHNRSVLILSWSELRAKVRRVLCGSVV